MEIIIYLLLVLISLSLGSFSNFIISRLRIKESGQNYLEKKGRYSICDKCQARLSWYDLIPVFSYLYLGGKCRQCDKQIAIHNLLVELGSVLLILLFYWQFGLSISFIFYYLMSMVLLMIFSYDLIHQLIPDWLIYFGIGIATVWQIYRLINYQESLFRLFWGIVVGGGVFYLIYIFSKGKWIGFGDVKLGLLIGLILSWPNVLIGLWLAVVLGGLISVVLLFKGRTMKSKIPFGPFLALGCLIVMLYSQSIKEILSIYFWY